MNTQKTLTIHHGRIRLVLDLDQVIPDDPGAGTPAVVESVDGKSSGTYWCACDTGELICGDRYLELTKCELDWLNRQDVVDQVELFLFGAPAEHVG